ncbi:MAG: transporter substrate-binding domain-containing protein [Pseudomonadota bacterium]
MSVIRFFYIFIILSFKLCLGADDPVVESLKQWDKPQKVILTTHNLAPLGSYPKNSPIQFIADDSFRGIVVDRVRQAFKELSIPLEIQVMPWMRAQAVVISQEAQGFFSASKQRERDDFAILSTVIIEQTWTWYLLKNNNLEPKMPIFKQVAEIGVFHGGNRLSWLESKGYSIKMAAKTPDELLKALLKGHVDAILSNNLVMENLIRKANVFDNVKSYKAKRKPLGVYFSKSFITKYPQFLENFNVTIETMKSQENF